MEDEKLMRGDQTSFYSLMRKRCINQKDFSDISFVIGSQKQLISAHKCILAARSDVFRSMFTQQSIHAGNHEVPYVLDNVRPEVFLTTLDYMYTSCCTLTPDLAPDVMTASLEFGLEGLRKLCVKYMLDALSVETVCSVLQCAVNHGQEDLLHKSLSFIEENTKEVIFTTKFLELSEQALGTILRSDDLDVDELDLLLAVRKWAGANHMITGRPISDLASSIIGLIRLPLLSADELSKVEDDNKEDQAIPVHQLAAAWRFHALKQNAPSSVVVKPRKGTLERETHKYLYK